MQPNQWECGRIIFFLTGLTQIVYNREKEKNKNKNEGNNEKLKKVMGQAVSLLIAIMMILPVVPLDYISAEDIKPLEKLDYSEEVYVIAEDTTKRGEFEKHFVLSDGSLVAVVYPESVHAMDYQMQWIDINNRLAISDEGYKNGNSSVILPELYGNDSFVSLNNDGLLFEWQFNACGVDGSFLEKNNSVGIIVENEQKKGYIHSFLIRLTIDNTHQNQFSEAFADYMLDKAGSEQ